MHSLSTYTQKELSPRKTVTGQPSRRPITTLTLVFIRPSKYDDDGYVIRYHKGFLPSNTITCLHALSEDVRRRQVLGSDLRWRIKILDDTVQKIPFRQIAHLSRKGGNKVVVCLAGVQTNQFPRASDLALRFAAEGVDVMIGGFHVSGSMAMQASTPPEIQRLLDAGVSVVLGEVEDAWQDILSDVLRECRRPMYDLLASPPDLRARPFPATIKRYLRHFISSNFGTIDCGRGCPFHCSFCTIINVQGRRMRCRDAETLIDGIRNNYRMNGVSFYFITDDNFARNRNWGEIFDGLIRLREEEGIPLTFMMQVDTLSHRIKGFIGKAKRAGCTQVFIGMESLNPKNLEAAEKTQNDVDDMSNLINAYHDEGIRTHAAYIVGFPFDTPDSVRADIEQLKALNVPQASFFMLTPLPGSRDHAEMVKKGVPIDEDLNQYDSFHPTMPHPRMSQDEWRETYMRAWRSFYSFESMRDILNRTSAEVYWNVFKNFLWVKSAFSIERQHPMVSGFWRWKVRTDRRSGYTVEPFWRFARARALEIWGKSRQWMAQFRELQELWLQTRKRTPLEQYLVEEIRSIRTDVRDWRELRTKELQDAYRRAVSRLKDIPAYAHVRIRVPSRFTLLCKKWNILSDRITYSRQSLQLFWRQTRVNLRRGRLYRLRPGRMVLYFFREAKLSVSFAVAMFASGIR